MRRRVLLYLTLIAVSACNGDRIAKPGETPANSPSADISDAVHTGTGFASNPDFFFLPPMVKDPSGSAAWDAGAFNANLRPTVEICAYDAAITTEAGLAGASCGTPTSTLATLVAAAEAYQLNWKVPTSSTTFYRITVKVGVKTLGFADVETASNASLLKNVATGDFIPLVDGRTLPIKFRIERYALCEVPGTPTCTSASGDISVAPLTVQTGTPDPSGISTATGITLPVQTQFTTPTPVTVTLSSCPSLNPRVLDLPTFGSCVRVTTDPVLPTLSDPATVFVCSVGINAPGLFTGLTETQEARVTLHQYDADGPNKGLRALPHAHACTQGYPGGVATIDPSVGAMLASLVHGRFKQAATAALALLAPKPLYAAMFIDLGGGGLVGECCSDFQFALPAKMEAVEGTDNQTAMAGAVLSPTVKVTDLGGEPVAGASVHFFTAAPAPAGDIVVTTGADGLASQPWTIAAGSNSLPVSGRGIASLSVNGPRGATGEFDSVFDPFQPIQSAFDPGFTGQAQSVFVLTGTFAFSATGLAPTASATASVSPQSFNGVCPTQFTFSGSITSTVPGIVTYIWERSDAGVDTNGPYTVSFDAPGTQATVQMTWYRGTQTSAAETGWERIKILSPNSAVSNNATFTQTCVPQ